MVISDYGSQRSAREFMFDIETRKNSKNLIEGMRITLVKD